MKRLSHRQINKLQQLRKRGLSYRQIDKQTGISYGAAYTYGREIKAQCSQLRIRVDGIHLIGLPHNSELLNYIINWIDEHEEKK